MFLTCNLGVANYRKFVIDVHTQLCYAIKQYKENTSWKVLAYGIYARVVDVSDIERVSAANE